MSRPPGDRPSTHRVETLGFVARPRRLAPATRRSHGVRPQRAPRLVVPFSAVPPNHETDARSLSRSLSRGLRERAIRSRSWLLASLLPLGCATSAPIAPSAAPPTSTCSRSETVGVELCAPGLRAVDGALARRWPSATLEIHDAGDQPLRITIHRVPRASLVNDEPRNDPSWLVGGSDWRTLGPERSLRVGDHPAVETTYRRPAPRVLLDRAAEGADVRWPAPQAQRALVRVIALGDHDVILAAEWAEPSHWESVARKSFDDARIDPR